MLFVAIIALISVSTQAQGVRSSDVAENGTCSKPWFVWHNQTCQCGKSLDHVIMCSDDHGISAIKNCYCMTADDEQKKPAMVGVCPYTCVIPQMWYPNGTELNQKLCNESWNRTGPLCSRCIDGYGPPVYSYSVQCIPCSPEVVTKSIVLFLTSFLLLTVFCLAIITLRISGARPPMSTFILVSQVMSAPQYLSLIFVPSGKSFVSSVHNYYVTKRVHDDCWKLFAAFFGLWNLDIFRSVYPQMCLSPNMTTLQAKFLEYAIALFPLAILVVVYFGITLYNQGYRMVFCVCRPVISCLARLRQTVNIQTSLIDAFATFIILAVNKIGYTSFIILQPEFVYYPNGSHTRQAYIEPSVMYFGWDHLPYALTALVLSLVLILIPLLLLFLYPLRSFQNFLNNRQWQCSTLHIFADTFQGCYKNGTSGTRDYRWFAGIHLLLRFIIILFYDMSNYYQLSSLLMVVSIALYIVLLAIFQPYKNHRHFKMDMSLLFGVLLWCTALSAIVMNRDLYGLFDFVIHLALLALASSIPFVFIVGVILHWLLVVKRFHMWVMVRLRQVLLSTTSTRLLNYSA